MNGREDLDFKQIENFRCKQWFITSIFLVRNITTKDFGLNLRRNRKS
jgi:hypothetical protein